MPRPLINPESLLFETLELMEERALDTVSFEGRRNRARIINNLRLLADWLDGAGRVPDIETVLREICGD